MILGIDASNIRAGGGLVHLRELLSVAEPEQSGFRKVVVWGGRTTLHELAPHPWLKLVWQPECDGGLLRRSLWQARVLPRLAQTAILDLLFTPGGTHVGGFRPYVTMVQNHLPFDLAEARRYGVSNQFLRLQLLRRLQLHTLRNASAVIFLTEHSRELVKSEVGPNAKTVVIPHGVSDIFRSKPRGQFLWDQYGPTRPYRFLYVSWVEPYKEHVKLVRAIGNLRAEGVPVALDLAGGGDDRTLGRLRAEIASIDPDGRFVRYHGAVQYPDVVRLYREADAFVFPSSCETFGMPVLEAMAAGLPVACSNRAVMPEVLGEAGAYFRPEVEDIAVCLKRFVQDVVARQRYAEAGVLRAASFSWSRTAQQTFDFLAQVVRHAGDVEQESPLEASAVRS